jgi:hypothetical protein
LLFLSFNIDKLEMYLFCIVGIGIASNVWFTAPCGGMVVDWMQHLGKKRISFMRRWSMKKRIMVLALLPLLINAFAGVSQAWQGRMGGMGDPYGLVADESDFLIHPTKIAKGEGVRFYGYYRFLYTGVKDWDYDLDLFELSPFALLGNYHFETSGQEYSHNALLGAGFPLGPGRMGLFFEYAGKRGDYDGSEDILGVPSFGVNDLTSGFDNFALRLLYGLPVGGFNLGGEVQLAYRQEENKALYYRTDGYALWENSFWDGLLADDNLFVFMLPYDSRYWEGLFKGALEGKVGPVDVELTLRGGFLFSGDNTYEYERQIPIGTPDDRFVLDGDVEGWRIGGDLWLRYLLGDVITLPVLVRMDYQTKIRDGEGPGLLGFDGDTFTYENKEQSLHLTIGGGVDKEINASAKIAAGIFYNYIQGKNDIEVQWYQLGVILLNYGYSGFPDSTEHRVMLRLSGELELSPTVTLRMGLVPFFGWVQEDFTFAYSSTANPYIQTDNVSVDGYHWGVGVSVGGSVRFQRLTLEPFVAAGYEELALDGDGIYFDNMPRTRLYEMDLIHRAWSIGAGFSFLFGL